MGKFIVFQNCMFDISERDVVDGIHPTSQAFVGLITVQYGDDVLCRSEELFLLVSFHQVDHISGASHVDDFMAVEANL